MSNLKLTPFSIGVTVVLIALIVFNLVTYFYKPKMAYVRSHDLIEKYQGTIEARMEFEKKKNGMTANVDSLKMDFERAKNQYINTAAKLSANERMQQEKSLTQQQGQLIQYSNAIDQKIEEEDNKMMQEVLNQINSFVEGYAVKNNYSVILGTTLSGSLLYGDKSLDVTDNLLVELNNHYKGK
jgi:outer membrane protein